MCPKTERENTTKIRQIPSDNIHALLFSCRNIYLATNLQPQKSVQFVVMDGDWSRKWHNKFLDVVSASSGFFQNDLNGMLALFQPVHKDNMVDISLHGPASSGDKRGKVPIYDDTIWGQPSNYLNITPTNAHGVTYTLEEKFGPYFAEEVQTTWVAWLGDLVNKDPATHKGDLNSWTSTMDMMTALSLLGFKTGLTVFQLVNSLVFLGLAKMPAPVEVAESRLDI